jgi:hypothetical protein
MMRPARPVAVALLALATLAAPCLAHTGGSTGYASIAIRGREVRYRLVLWPAAMTEAVARSLELARAGDARGRDDLLGTVRGKVSVRAQGGRCEPGEGVVEPGDKDSVAVVVRFACPADVQDLLVRDDLFDAFGRDHHTLARLDGQGGSAQFAFTPETREARFTVEGGAPRGVASFLRLGVEHILLGWDHLLFLVGLLLPGGGWLALAKIITAFTLAHSVTLALAVLDVVALPDRLVEAVIALSIACVAAENLVRRPLVSRRWLVSFLFGLVHGFGFSSVLREIGLPAQGVALSLLGFNVGVEIGQAMVVALTLPALALLRTTRWEPRMVWSSSLAILLVGVFLFVHRAFL